MRKLLLLFLLFLLACSSKVEQQPVLDKQLFVQIYCDVVSKADLLPPEQKKTYVDSILTHYKVTPREFENTVKMYSKSPEQWKDVFEDIVAELEKRSKQLDKAQN